MMLRHLGEHDAADRITAAALKLGSTEGGTVAIGDAIAAAVS
jgi:isocitrate/isopropylmalate dehydrogenase